MPAFVVAGAVWVLFCLGFRFHPGCLARKVDGAAVLFSGRLPDPASGVAAVRAELALA